MSSIVSIEKVLIVLKPPQNPVTINKLVEALNFSLNKKTKSPKIKQAKIFAINVAQGKTVENPKR